MRHTRLNDTLNDTTGRHHALKPATGANIGVLLGYATDILLASKSEKAARKAIRSAAMTGAEKAAENARRIARFANNEIPQNMKAPKALRSYDSKHTETKEVLAADKQPAVRS